jgi:hypothetical protein
MVVDVKIITDELTQDHTPEAMPFNGIGIPMLMDGLKIIHANWIASKYPMPI